MDEYDGYVEPAPERFRHDPIEQQTKWEHKRRQFTVHYIKDPLVADKLCREHKISAKMHQAALMIRDLWYSIGHRRVTVAYEVRIQGRGEMSDQKAAFWGLYNALVRAVPPHARSALLTLCCDDEWVDEDLAKEALKAILAEISALRRKNDERLRQYLAFTRGLDGAVHLH